jgi:hypothetical protein
MSARPTPRLVGGSIGERRLRRVEEAFASMPERYLGAEDDYPEETHELVRGFIERDGAEAPGVRLRRAASA